VFFYFVSTRIVLVNKSTEQRLSAINSGTATKKRLQDLHSDVARHPASLMVCFWDEVGLQKCNLMDIFQSVAGGRPCCDNRLSGGGHP
jgi:hypothetical protein